MWPQVIMIILLTVSVWEGITNHGKMEETNGWYNFIGAVIMVLILLKGGFWTIN
jgi:hypothetical protein